MDDDTRIGIICDFMRNPKEFADSVKDVDPFMADIAREFANVSRTIVQARARCDYKLFHATHYKNNLEPCRAVLQKEHGLTDAERNGLTKGFSPKTKLRGDRFHDLLVKTGKSRQRIIVLLALMEDHERSVPNAEDFIPARR